MFSQETRRKYLAYFREKGHTITPSASVVPHDDPTLLFTNAGMNPFKDVFLGKAHRDYRRAASSQKCIRVGGKHNDLDNVGHTSRHTTFFEMLGNFSFGDYFKKEAIQFAWEVSTEVFGFDPERIWPTVFTSDDESFELWTAFVPPERISRFGESENFWAMGDTGPCGPCSELLFDKGPDYGEARNPVEDSSGERFFEFWNLVFMQYQRDPEGEITDLPRPSIDTGAGLERVVSLQMGKENLFTTDILGGLVDEVARLSGRPYVHANLDEAAPYHVIADHLRCLAFAIADGAQPSNVERGYVLRKVLRRAVRYGKMLGFQEPFLGQLLPRLSSMMGEDYPELVESESRMAEILFQEEEAFFRTLRRGGTLLQKTIDRAHEKGDQITGDEAFKLKDTYGLPLEEIVLLAKDAHLTVDIPAYEKLEQEARERSRRSQKTTQQLASESIFSAFVEEQGPCQFLGYKTTEAVGTVIGLFVDGEAVDTLLPGQEGMVIVNETPFYAEKGGQVGDTGHFSNKEIRYTVTDCQEPYKEVIAHLGKLDKGELVIGAEVSAVVDATRRQKIANNHTATHLLHWALQKVLGEHIRQAGSVVDPSRLRFDFSHHKAVSTEEIRHIEDLVNQRIRENAPVQSYEISYEEAQQQRDIKQFFGEKYDSLVRVIDIDFSKELCGGTHTSSTGNIGYFRIAKESSIAAGVRRIEAVTGPEAEVLAREPEERLVSLATSVKTVPQKLEERMSKILEESEAIQREKKQWQEQRQKNTVQQLIQQIAVTDDIRYVVEKIESPPETIRELAIAVLEKIQKGIVVLGTAAEDKCLIAIHVSEGVSLHAGELAKILAPLVQGGGGGKPHQSQVGGKNPEQLSAALAEARRWIEEKITTNG